MKNLSDLEQEKQQLLQELEALKKQIQKDIFVLETKYSTKNITKNISRELSKKYLNKRLFFILGISAGTALVLYWLSRNRKRKKVKCSGIKTEPQSYAVARKDDKPSFVADLAKEVLWTIALELVRKKVNDYVKKKTA
ncbi:MAG: hypothetical protein NZ519_00515 [Bacteroidia bacterium]|nr:hypothetical protein [Bacteroidia bacterium]